MAGAASWREIMELHPCFGGDKDISIVQYVYNKYIYSFILFLLIMVTSYRCGKSEKQDAATTQVEKGFWIFWPNCLLVLQKPTG